MHIESDACIIFIIGNNLIREILSSSLCLSHPTVSYFIQTLKKHDLSSNQIEAQVAQHLSDAFRNYTVRQILSSSFCLSLQSFRLVLANGGRNSGRKALIGRKKPKRKSLKAKIVKEKVSRRLKKILAGENTPASPLSPNRQP
jgi:hypothetical protein